MQYLSHFTHAFFMFVTPLNFLGYKSTTKQKIVFTILYGLAINFFRKIYDFFPVPFGTHTIILVILNIILFKLILQNIRWKTCIYTCLILYIILLINDLMILVPIMNFFNLTVNQIESNVFLRFIIIIVSNVILIVAATVGYLKNKNTNHAILYK